MLLVGTLAGPSIAAGDAMPLFGVAGIGFLIWLAFCRHNRHPSGAFAGGVMTAIDQTTSPLTIAATMFELMEQAWNRADGAAFGALFDDDTDFVNIHGAHLRGDAAFIGRGHQVLFDGIYAGSKVRYRVDIAREVSPGCVVAVVTRDARCSEWPTAGNQRGPYHGGDHRA